MLRFAKERSGGDMKSHVKTASCSRTQQQRRCLHLQVQNGVSEVNAKLPTHVHASNLFPDPFRTANAHTTSLALFASCLIVSRTLQALYPLQLEVTTFLSHLNPQHNISTAFNSLHFYMSGPYDDKLVRTRGALYASDSLAVTLTFSGKFIVACNFTVSNNSSIPATRICPFSFPR
jgi:hypothetical protein